MILAAAALTLLAAQGRGTGSEVLPIPFPSPFDASIQTVMVSAEKALGKSDFALAEGIMNDLSFQNVAYSFDVKVVPESRRKEAEEALEAGIALWRKALGAQPVFTRNDAAPNLIIKITPGYSFATAGADNTALNGSMGCMEVESRSSGPGRRVVTVRIYADEGPEGTPHKPRSLSKLAAKAMGLYFGLGPKNGVMGVMSFDVHSAFGPIDIVETETDFVKEMVKSSALIMAAAKDKKKIELELPVIEIADSSTIGVITNETSMSTEIPFKNTGDAVLRIKEVIADCKCVAREWDQEVKPGETGKIRVTYDPSKAAPGVVTKRLVIRSNDAMRPEVYHTISCVVMRDISTFPGTTVVDLPSDRDGEAQFFVYSPTGKPFKIQTIDVVPARYPVKFEPAKMSFKPSEFPNLAAEERSGYTVTVTIPATDAGGGQINARAMIKTEGDSLGGGQLTHMMVLNKGIRLSPGTIHMGVRGDEVDKRTVVLEERNGTFKILGVELSSPELDTTIETLEDGHRYRVWFTPKKGLEPGTRQVRALIATDDPRQPKLPVTVWLDVAPPAGKLQVALPFNPFVWLEVPVPTITASTAGGRIAP